MQEVWLESERPTAKQLETYQTALAISLILVGQKFSIMSTHRANDGLEVSLKQRKNQSSCSPA